MNSSLFSWLISVVNLEYIALKSMSIVCYTSFHILARHSNCLYSRKCLGSRVLGTTSLRNYRLSVFTIVGSWHPFSSWNIDQ